MTDTTNPSTPATEQIHNHRGTHGPTYTFVDREGRDNALDHVDWEDVPWTVEETHQGTLIHYQEGEWCIVYDAARLTGGRIEHAVQLVPSHRIDGGTLSLAERTEGFAFASTAADYIVDLMEQVENGEITPSTDAGAKGDTEPFPEPSFSLRDRLANIIGS